MTICSAFKLKNAKQAYTYYELKDETYYTKGEYESEWLGKTSKELGYLGKIKEEEFEKLLRGTLPNGVQISANKAESERTPGTDVTFSAPKSVSMACFLGDEERIKRAFEESAKEVMAWAEKECAFARITENKKTKRVKTGNLSIAMFPHENSREMDMQLHIHCLVMNYTKCEDGQYRALDNYRLFKNKMLMGAMARSTFAKKLEKFGYELEFTGPNGMFEIKGFTKEQMEYFSKRSKQIKKAAEGLAKRVEKIRSKNKYLRTDKEKYLLKLYENGDKSLAKMKAILSVDSRKKKEYVDREKLKAEWKQIAKNIGIEFVPPKSKDMRKKWFRKAICADQYVELAIGHHSERSTQIYREDILKFCLERGTGRLLVEDVEKAIDRKIKAKDLIDLGDNKYTTMEALCQEKSIMNMVKKGRGEKRRIYSQREIAKIIEKSNENLRRFTGNPNAMMTDGQAKAVENILTSKDAVVAVNGNPGTGKTLSLDIVRELAEKKGYEVRGFAQNTTAVGLLAKDAGIGGNSKTIAKLFCTRFEKPKKPELWIVDECSLVGTEDAERLLKLAERAGARVVLVGDYEQMPAVTRGKPFAQLIKSESVQVTILDEIMRQEKDVIKKAVDEVVKGPIKDQRDVKALEILKDTVFKIKNRDKRLSNLSKAYLRVEYVSEDRNVQKGDRVRWQKDSEWTKKGEQALIQGIDKRENLVTFYKLDELGRPLEDQGLYSIRFDDLSSKDYLFRKDYMDRQIITGRNADRIDINNQVRDGLQEVGALGKDSIKTQILRTKSEETKKSTRLAASYTPGETVRFISDYKTLGIKRGSYGKVLSVERDNNMVQIDVDGRQINWDPIKFNRVTLFSKEEREISAGELIRFNHNHTDSEGNKRCNGQFARIESIEQASKTASFHYIDDKGNKISKMGTNKLDLNNVNERHFDHGYVSTIYLSQGMTVKDIFIHIDTKGDKAVLGHEAWLVAISRAKQEAFIYTDDPNKVPDAITREMVEKSALELADPTGKDKRIHKLVERNVIRMQKDAKKQKTNIFGMFRSM